MPHVPCTECLPTFSENSRFFFNVVCEKMPCGGISKTAFSATMSSCAKQWRLALEMLLLFV